MPTWVGKLLTFSSTSVASLESLSSCTASSRAVAMKFGAAPRGAPRDTSKASCHQQSSGTAAPGAS